MKTLLILLVSFVFLCVSMVSAQQGETEKAIEFYRNGDFSSALNILKMVVETDKEDRKAWLYLGACYVRSRNEKLAREAFKKADSLLPKKYSLEDNIKFNEGLKITLKPRVPYSERARAEGIQGTVKFAVEYGADGKIKFIFPFQTLMPGLTEACLESAKKIQYDPARKNGKPVTVVGITSYNFTIY